MEAHPRLKNTAFPITRSITACALRYSSGYSVITKMNVSRAVTAYEKAKSSTKKPM
jgi:hypothetical protein